jgi:hypothetical protein
MDSFDVSFAVLDTNNVHGVFIQGVVNPNPFESSDGPWGEDREAADSWRNNSGYMRILGYLSRVGKRSALGAVG